MLRWLSPLAILFALHGAAAQERETLEGWGPFRFGMTLDEAQRAAGITARRYILAVALDVEIEGEPYTASATALGESGKFITSISLSRTRAKQEFDQEKCHRLFEEPLALVTAKYGRPDGEPATTRRGHQVRRSVTWSFKDGGRIELRARFDTDWKTQIGSFTPCSIHLVYEPGKLANERPKGTF